MDPLTIALIGSSLLSGWLGNRKRTTTSKVQNTSHQRSSSFNQGTQASYNKSMPVYDQNTLNLRDNLIQQVTDRMRQPVADPRLAAQAMTTQNIRGLNQQGGLQNQAIANAMRQRGLFYSPAMGSAMANAEAGRVKSAFDFINNEPLLQRQLEQENEATLNNRQQLAQQLFGMIPKGTENEGFVNTANVGTDENWGESTSIGENTDPGNQLGGMFGSLAGALGFIMGQKNGGIMNSNAAPIQPINTQYNPMVPNVYRPSNQVPQQTLPSWAQPQYPAVPTQTIPSQFQPQYNQPYSNRNYYGGGGYYR